MSRKTLPKKRAKITLSSDDHIKVKLNFKSKIRKPQIRKSLGILPTIATALVLLIETIRIIVRLW